MPPAVILVPSLRRGDKISLKIPQLGTVIGYFDSASEIGITLSKDNTDKLFFYPFYNILEVEF